MPLINSPLLNGDGGSRGIAIGPILFVVALLGILAAAIAAGSGSFTGSTTSESDKTKAAALIQIGENLKFGVERIIGSGVDVTSINADPTSTTAANDLFAPMGGGISPPSTTMLVKTAGYAPYVPKWEYMFTTSTGGWGIIAEDYTAYAQVSLGVCNAINQRANGVATPPLVHIAIIAPGVPGHTSFNADFDTLKGNMVGCFYTDHIYSLGYWFFEVLSIQ